MALFSDIAGFEIGPHQRPSEQHEREHDPGKDEYRRGIERHCPAPLVRVGNNIVATSAKALILINHPRRQKPELPLTLHILRSNFAGLTSAVAIDLDQGQRGRRLDLILIKEPERRTCFLLRSRFKLV